MEVPTARESPSIREAKAVAENDASGASTPGRVFEGVITDDIKDRGSLRIPAFVLDRGSHSSTVPGPSVEKASKLWAGLISIAFTPSTVPLS